MKQERHKILLIEPPYYRLFKDTYSLSRYPLSLGYLAGTIKKETKWDVMVYNADFSPKDDDEGYDLIYMRGVGFDNYLKNLNDLSSSIWDEIKLTIHEYEPDVIGISIKAPSYISSSIIAKLAKEIDNQIILIVGGPHPSTIEEDILRDPNMDIAVIGEGENTIIELLNTIEKQEPFNKVKGIIYRDNLQIVKNPPREFIEDLDLLCYPHQYAREVLKDYDHYPINAFSNIFATRGCPNNCLFCGVRDIWTRRVRFRSVANVTNEIKSLQRMGLNFINFDDDTFGVSKKYINQLCNSIIQNCPGLEWKCEIHANLIDEQTIALMKKAGCRHIAVGMESGNNEILKEIRKGITIEEAISAAKIIIKHGIELTAFFMVGFPGETEKTLNDTLWVMKKIKGNICYSIFTPYPGTEAFELCEKNGLIATNYNIALYNHQSPANCFCMNMTKEQFRKKASEIEDYVMRHGREQVIRNAMKHPAMTMRNYGLSRCFRYLKRTLN